MADLVVEKRIVVACPAAQVFDAWLDPAKVVQWISADAVRTPVMHSDPVEGGAYRIEIPRLGGTTVIEGEYETLHRDELLVFTWRCSAFPGERTRVTVRFQERGASTEVSLVHENFDLTETCQMHSLGWDSCLQLIVRSLDQDKED